MDIIVLLFGISLQATEFESPKQPQAAVVEVIKLNTDTVDIHSDMWNPDWINKNNE